MSEEKGNPQVSPAQQSMAGARPDDSWSPERAAALLKTALYIGVVAAGWLVMRSTAGRATEDIPDSELRGPNADDYLPWEPKP